MDNNKLYLLGRVGKIDIEYKENGTILTTISLGVKNYKKEWENYYITFFNDTAERLAEDVKDGDYIRIDGSLGIDKFTPKGSEKPVYKIKITGWGFKKVEYDKEQKKFIDFAE
jgi:single-stranded DNA-binding protein